MFYLKKNCALNLHSLKQGLELAKRALYFVLLSLLQAHGHCRLLPLPILFILPADFNDYPADSQSWFGDAKWWSEEWKSCIIKASSKFWKLKTIKEYVGSNPFPLPTPPPEKPKFPFLDRDKFSISSYRMFTK